MWLPPSQEEDAVLLWVKIAVMPPSVFNSRWPMPWMQSFTLTKNCFGSVTLCDMLNISEVARWKITTHHFSFPGVARGKKSKGQKNHQKHIIRLPMVKGFRQETAHGWWGQEWCMGMGWGLQGNGVGAPSQATEEIVLDSYCCHGDCVDSLVIFFKRDVRIEILKGYFPGAVRTMEAPSKIPNSAGVKEGTG